MSNAVVRKTHVHCGSLRRRGEMTGGMSGGVDDVDVRSEDDEHLNSLGVPGLKGEHVAVSTLTGTQC